MRGFDWPRNRAERREAARWRAEEARRPGRPDRLATSKRRPGAAVVDLGVTAVGGWLTLAGATLAGPVPDVERALAVYALGGTVVGNVHTLVTTAVRGQTLGKLLTSIRVVRSDTFDVPGWKRAAIRTLGLIPLGAVPNGGVIATAADGSFLFSRTRQGLHDVLAGTIVVDDREWRRWRAQSARPKGPRTRRTS